MQTELNRRLSWSLLILSFLAATGMGCREPGQWSHDKRRTVPADLNIARSLNALTNSFSAHNKRFHYTVQLTPDQKFAVLSRFTHSGIRSFEAYCYEQIDDDLWHLRSVNSFSASDSMTVELSPANGSLTLVHDGTPLFTIHPAAAQIAWQSQSRIESNFQSYEPPSDLPPPSQPLDPRCKQLIRVLKAGDALGNKILLEELRAGRIDTVIESLEFAIDTAVTGASSGIDLSHPANAAIRQNLLAIKEYRAVHPREIKPLSNSDEFEQMRAETVRQVVRILSELEPETAPKPNNP